MGDSIAAPVQPVVMHKIAFVALGLVACSGSARVVDGLSSSEGAAAADAGPPATMPVRFALPRDPSTDAAIDPDAADAASPVDTGADTANEDAAALDDAADSPAGPDASPPEDSGPDVYDAGVDAYDATPPPCVPLTKAQACGTQKCGPSQIPVGCGLPVYDCGDCLAPNQCDWTPDAGYACTDCRIDPVVSATCRGGNPVYPNGWIGCLGPPGGGCLTGSQCTSGGCVPIYCCQ